MALHAQSHSSTSSRRQQNTENFIRRASSKSFTEKETSIAATLAIVSGAKIVCFYLTPYLCTGIIVFWHHSVVLQRCFSGVGRRLTNS